MFLDFPSPLSLYNPIFSFKITLFICQSKYVPINSHISALSYEPIDTSKFSSPFFLSYGPPLLTNNVFLACIMIEISLVGMLQISFTNWVALLRK